MRALLLNQDRVVGDFMEHAMGVENAFRNGRGIGVIDMRHETEDAAILAGIWFESYNGANMMMHVAAIPGSRWMTKELLWYAFYYPFIECGCKRVTGLVAESNKDAREFDERLGFRLEARLEDAAPDGDLLVYVMFRDQCRWLALRERTQALRNKVN